MTTSGTAIEPLADALDQFPLDPVQAFVLGADHQDLLLAPARALDLFEVRDLGLEAPQGQR
jgi:hypothetical protein